MPRPHSPSALRSIEIRTGYLDLHPASVLYSSGRTRVLCVATLEPTVPPFVDETRRGWATAEYDLLPGSTHPRHARERSGRLSGRTQEIQRLVGRSLRGVLDLAAMPGRTLRVDCDVIQADGGTRTAAISGAYVATAIAVRDALAAGSLSRSPLTTALAAVSVGVCQGRLLLDLDYEEDSSADVDLNVVMTADDRFLEIQGTAERSPFDRAQLDAMLDLAAGGIREILTVQNRAIAAGS